MSAVLRMKSETKYLKDCSLWNGVHTKFIYICPWLVVMAAKSPVVPNFFLRSSLICESRVNWITTGVSFHVEIVGTVTRLRFIRVWRNGWGFRGNTLIRHMSEKSLFHIFFIRFLIGLLLSFFRHVHILYRSVIFTTRVRLQLWDGLYFSQIVISSKDVSKSFPSVVYFRRITLTFVCAECLNASRRHEYIAFFNWSDRISISSHQVSVCRKCYCSIKTKCVT